MMGQTMRSSEKKPSKSEETKGHMMKAAIESFIRYGYEGSAMRDIANAAGASMGLIRYHFGRKEDLYRDTLAFVSEQYNAVCLEALAEARQTGSPEEIVYAWLAAPLTRWRDASVASGEDVLRFLNKMGYEAPELTRDVYESHFSYALGEWQEALRSFFPGMQEADWLWCMMALRGMYFNIVAHHDFTLWSLPAINNKEAAIRRLSEDAVLLLGRYAEGGR